MLFWNLMKRQIEKHDAALAAAAKAEVYEEIAAWNTRRLEAEAKGLPFDEAPPSQNGTPGTIANSNNVIKD